MTRQDVLRVVEEIVDLKPHTLVGSEILADLPGWDSMSTMVFIAMIDKEFGIPLQGGRVARCQTADELIALLGVASAIQAA